MASAWAWTRFAALALPAVLSQQCGATPYIPDTDTQILETLPTRNDPQQRALAKLRAALQADPGNQMMAANLARYYVTIARNDADPRYLGYAQAALTPWWGLAHPPAEILLLRATIMQSTHHFALALTDLDLLITSNSGNAQAWITRATVLQVIGEFDQAKKSCAHLFGIAPNLVLRTCLASVGDVTGAARGSYQSLQAALDGTPNADPATREWILTLLGEMAERIGAFDDAQSYFRQALALSANDTYLLGAYADFLLNQKRFSQVIELLTNRQRADSLLLRYTLALDATRSPQTAQFTAMLRDRFDAAMQRGDTVHLREQSRFELHLMKNPKRALQLAQQNWAVQKEPADVMVYLEASEALHDVWAAKSVLDWLAQTGLEDVNLDRLRQTLRS